MDFKLLDAKMEEYKSVFGDIFPTAYLDGNTDAIIDTINECLATHKDAYDVLDIDVDDTDTMF